MKNTLALCLAGCLLFAAHGRAAARTTESGSTRATGEAKVTATGWPTAPPPARRAAAAPKRVAPVRSASRAAASTVRAKSAAPARAAEPAASAAVKAAPADRGPAFVPVGWPMVVEPPPAAATTAAAAPARSAPVEAAPEDGIMLPPRPAVPPAPKATEAPAVASAQPAPKPVAKPAPKQAALKRFLEVPAAAVSVRYRQVTNSKDVRTNNQVQDNQGFKLRFKLDPQGHYSVHLGLFTGSGLTSGWNNTGLGTGDAFTKIFLKQLYFAGQPAPGLEFQYGSLYAARGENTEVIHYDNDVYVTGMRASIKRPKALFFDEISVTQAYLGDAARPSVFDRGHRIVEANYWQALVAKRWSPRVAGSADITRASGIDTVRGAFTLKAREMRVLDLVRLEAYHRLVSTVAPAASGFSLYGERTIAKRVMVGGGWADIDPRSDNLNGDRYMKGRRLFANSTVTLTPELAVQTFYTLAVDTPYAIPNKTRLDVILTYNVLKSLQRTGQF